MAWWLKKGEKRSAGASGASRREAPEAPASRPFLTREAEPRRVGEAFLDYVLDRIPQIGSGLMVVPATGVNAMRVIASIGHHVPAPETMLPPETGVLAGALRLGRPILRRDGRPPKAPFEAELGEDAAATPISHQGDIIGAIAIYGPQGSIGSPEQQLLADCREAGHGALLAALRLSRAEADLTVQRSIVDLAARLIGGLDKEQLVTSVLECSLELTASDTGSVMLLDEQGHLRIASARGLPPEIVRSTVISLGEGISGWVARTGKGMVIEDAKGGTIGRHATRETRSAVSVPMATPEGDLYGVINVGTSSATARHTDVAVRLLTELGELAAMALRTTDIVGGGATAAISIPPGKQVIPKLAACADESARRKVDAVLLDLDGTLLDLDMDLFWRRYFDRLGQAFKDLADPARFVSAVRGSTHVMLRNVDPARTNKEVFWEDFAPKVGIDPAVLAPRIDEFYDREFPKLKDYSEPVPLARDVVEAALALGVPVVIATNPVFPHRAVEHRLEWAGIADLPYAMVTSYEFMHACKPSPEYYLEIAELLDVRSERCLMVGNDEEDDLAAEEMGMRCFLVQDRALGRTSRYRAADSGSMADLLEYLRSLA